MISVVLLTYNRLAYAEKTLFALKHNLKTKEEIKVVIASDGDTEDYQRRLHEIACMWVSHSNVVHTDSARGGYGKNYNLAMQSAHENEWVLPVEDDWELLKPLELDQMIADMKALDIGCARLGYVGYTQALQGTFCRAQHENNCGHWLRFAPDSPEPHVFAGHPRIESRAWSRMVGPWKEGLLPGETEFEVAHRKEARTNVGWPLDVVKPSGDLFAHIGTHRSW